VKLGALREAALRAVSPGAVKRAGADTRNSARPAAGQAAAPPPPDAVPGASAHPTARAAATVAHDPALHGARVLLVDDNPINRAVAVEMLTSMGIAVEAAPSGEAALAALARDGRTPDAPVALFDAVLLDIQMPGMDGYQTATAIRARNAGGSLRLRPGAPVIAFTARVEGEDEEAMRRAGIVTRLPKPVERAELLATLRRYLPPRPVPAPAHGPSHGPTDEPATAAPPPQTAGGKPQGHRPAPEDLPAALPGLDVAGGVRRMNGKAWLYLRVLGSFVAAYSGAGEELRGLVAAAAKRADPARPAADADAWRTLSERAHAMAGAAGSISADEVNAAARAMERLGLLLAGDIPDGEVRPEEREALAAAPHARAAAATGMTERFDAAVRTACRSIRTLLETHGG
jgi:CheY-like chemotaxis protein/HPt (histidine-containing phosphotransfer) domain-containing protein